MLKDFREFINRGNAIDLAIGVVIGAAFNQIVSSIVEDLLTPLIGIIMGGINFEGQAITIGGATLTYGNLIQAIINFLLTALALFFIVKGYNRFKKKEEENPETKPPQDVLLLIEIRDLLKANASRPAGASPNNPPSSVAERRNP